MNLTDEQLRSLRATAEPLTQGAAGQHPGMDEEFARAATPRVVLALVEEVERLRAFEGRAANALGEAYVAGMESHTHPTSDEGTSYCPLAESLQREVGRLRGERAVDEALVQFTQAQDEPLVERIAELESTVVVLNARLAAAAELLERADTERDALAAKADAGKGLYEAAQHFLNGDDPPLSGSAFMAARIAAIHRLDAALARWEAANAE